MTHFRPREAKRMTAAIELVCTAEAEVTHAEDVATEED